MKKRLFISLLMLLFSVTLPALADNPWDPGLPEKFEAACNNGKGKSYIFAGSQYWRWDNEDRSVDSGYPKQISAGWSGLPNDIDAATNGVTGKGKGKLYFFKGSQYWRWDVASDTLDSGYPKSISIGWPGLNISKIDCALPDGGGDIVFVSGDQLWIWDMATDTLDRTEKDDVVPASPDAAIYDETEDKACTFFKGDSHWNFE